MTDKKIIEAEALAKMFLRRIDDLRIDQKGEYTHSSPKQSGALRRASMDLTRALAEMRRPG